MSKSKRKYSLGQAWDKEEDRLCRAVKRLHTTSDPRETSPESSEDDAGSPVSHLPKHSQHSQQGCRLPSTTLAASGLGMHLTGGILGPESGMAASPAESCTRQAFPGSSAASSPVARMSLGRTRSKHLSRETREDTPDPRPPPQSYNGPSPSAQPFLQQHPTRAPSTTPWRCRKPAAAPIAEVPGAPGSAQPGDASEPSSLPHAALRSSSPSDGSQAPAQQQTPMEDASSIADMQPQATATKWALKFRMPPQHVAGATGAAAAPADRHLSDNAEDPAGPSSSHSMGDMQQASLGAEAATLPSRLRRVQLSGRADSTSSIEEPLTPGRTERSSSAAGEQRSAFQPGQSSYDSLYEEANNLLKNLHFQRMLRHGPESPEPSAGGFTQYKSQ